MADRHPEGTSLIEHDAVPPGAASVPDIALMASPGPAGRVAFVAILVAVVGAWGGSGAFAGPATRFSADGTSAWHWNMAHALLWLVPGAAAVLSAFALLALVPSTRRDRGRVGTAAAGVAVVVCGARFVIGPVAWPALHPSTAVFTPASPLRALAYRAVYSLGPGSVLLALGGMVLAWGLRRRAPSPARPVSLVT